MSILWARLSRSAFGSDRQLNTDFNSEVEVQLVVEMKILHSRDYKLDAKHWIVFVLSVSLCAFSSVLILEGIASICYSVLFAVLLSLASAVDWKYGVIPNLLNLLIVILAIILLVDRGFYQWNQHIIGGLVGFASIRFIGVLFEKIKGREGIGAGDAKLFGAIGLMVTWTGLPAVMLIASTTGILVYLVAQNFKALPSGRLAFAPFISLGSWVVWLYQLSEQLI